MTQLRQLNLWGIDDDAIDSTIDSYSVPAHSAPEPTPQAPPEPRYISDHEKAQFADSLNTTPDQAGKILDTIRHHAVQISETYAHTSHDHFALRDDLEQIGIVAALTSASSFDPDNGATLNTYLNLRIKGAMLTSQERFYRDALAYPKELPQTDESEGGSAIEKVTAYLPAVEAKERQALHPSKIHEKAATIHYRKMVGRAVTPVVANTPVKRSQQIMVNREVLKLSTLHDGVRPRAPSTESKKTTLSTLRAALYISSKPCTATGNRNEGGFTDMTSAELYAARSDTDADADEMMRHARIEYLKDAPATGTSLSWDELIESYVLLEGLPPEPECNSPSLELLQNTRLTVAQTLVLESVYLDELSVRHTAAMLNQELGVDYFTAPKVSRIKEAAIKKMKRLKRKKVAELILSLDIEVDMYQ